eukprot:m.18335 g.18335  ORF g.18335 m.18335 type:complete len:233 (-) comp10787_c0_seq2:63-761(-)
MMATFPRVVVPGDSVELPESPDTVIKLGPGLRLHAEDNNSCAIVTTAGVLRHREPNDYWVDITSKRPLAAQGELVIGIVTNNPGENYQVDIGTPASARLNGLAFEAATRRNRPRLENGDIVYARVVLANKDMEPELTCVNSSGKAGGMGPLTGGLLRECPLGLCRRLLRKGCTVLQELGSRQKFEIAVGMNGRLWVKAPQPSDTIIVANSILASEYMSDKQIKRMVERLYAK